MTTATVHYSPLPYLFDRVDRLQERRDGMARLIDHAEALVRTSADTHDGLLAAGASAGSIADAAHRLDDDRRRADLYRSWLAEDEQQLDQARAELRTALQH